ncbi:MAG TPA: hypothetical protein VKH81_24675 [Candidatus Angelobacter sp.]|nr:hypothetical protein [Candidatus Angelobacter sp.]
MSKPQPETLSDNLGSVPGRQLSGDHGMLFDLNAEIASLEAAEDRATQGASRTTSMLVKYPGLRIALITMRAGATWDNHKTEARISVQPLRGQIKFKTPGSTVNLSAGQLLILDPAVPHAVEAIEESVFLLTLAPPHQT